MGHAVQPNKRTLGMVIAAHPKLIPDKKSTDLLDDCVNLNQNSINSKIKKMATVGGSSSPSK